MTVHQHRASSKRRRNLLIGGLASIGLVVAGLVPSLTAANAAPALIANPGQYVNVFGGTGNGGGEVGDINDFPGPAMPFGMVQFSPDTNSGTATTGAAWNSGRNGAGYHYPDRVTRGFSMTHASQGCSLYGDMPIIPSTFADFTATGNNGAWAQRLGYNKTADPSVEYGEPGYYRLKGTDSTGSVITSELSATTRAATATFTYPAGKTPQVFLKPNQQNNSSGYGGEMSVDPVTGTVTAQNTTGNFCSKGNRYTVYYALKFDQPWSGFGTWAGTAAGAAVANRTYVSNTGTNEFGGYFTFPQAATGESVVRVRMAISYVSAANAVLNLDTEIPTLGPTTLDTVKAANQAAWNSYLGKIEVSGPLASGQTPTADPNRDLKAFYTSFYHSITHPSTFSDVNGQYIGFETTPMIHQTSEKPAAGGRQRIQYSSFSDWDTYRCQAAEVAAFWPEIASDQAQSLVNAAEQMGSFPQWTVANATTNQMTGDNVAPLLVSTYALGARDWDVAGGLNRLIEAAIGATAGKWTGGTNSSMGNTLPMVQRPGATLYNERHYAPQSRWYQADHAISGASYTEEYAVDDFAIAKLAEALGRTSDAETFMARSHYWQNLFNPTTNFIQPRDLNGKFPEGNAMVQYTPDTSNQNAAAFGWTHPNKNPDGFGQVGYDEGNAEQYLWFVPHNNAALVDALGGKQAVSARLDSFFTKLKVGPQVDNRGGPYMFAGNEPNFNAPWIYSYIGQPWKSTEVVDRMAQQIFGYGPTDAAPGNDDLGAMSSWLVWAGIGAYPVTPGIDVMAVNTPMFEQVIVHRGDGKNIVINAPGAQSDRDSVNGKYRYISSMKIDGEATSQTSFNWADLTKTTTNIDYELSSTPPSWGSAAADAPPSYREGGNGVAANINPSSNAYFGVMGGAPGGTASGRLDVARIEATSPTYTVSGTAGHPGIELRDPGTRSFNAAGHAVANLTWEIGDFVPSNVYEVTVTVTAGGHTGTATGHIRVSKPGSLESFRNIVGTSFYDAPRGRFDTGTGTTTNLYARDELVKAGFTPGSTQQLPVGAGADMSFVWPGSPHQYPDAFDPSIATTIRLDRPASRLSLVGASITPTMPVIATLWLTDGTNEKWLSYDASMGDWQNPTTTGNAATGDLDMAYDNTKVLWMPWRITASANSNPLTATGEPAFAVRPGPYIYATKAFVADPGWKVTAITMPPGISSGTTRQFNTRIFAIAQDNPTIALTQSQAAAGGSVTLTGSGFAPFEPVTLTLATTPKSTVVVEADALGQLNGTVQVPRATSSLGTYQLTATADSVPQPATVALTVSDLYTFAPAVTAASQGVVDGPVDFAGSGFEFGETVTVSLGGTTITVIADSTGAVAGTIAAPDVSGDYTLTITGLTSKKGATAVVSVEATPDPTVTVPGPTVTEPGATVTAPGATILLPGPAASTVTLAPPSPSANAGGKTVKSVKWAQKTLTLVKGGSAKVPAYGYTEAGQKVKLKFTITKGKKLVKVSATGKVSAKKVGRAVIKAAAGGKSTKLVVRVVSAKPKAKVKSIKANAPKTLAVGKSKLVTVTYKPVKVAKALVRYSSTNKAVFVVDKAGRVTAVAPGKAVLKVKVGSKTKRFTITVK